MSHLMEGIFNISKKWRFEFFCQAKASTFKMSMTKQLSINFLLSSQSLLLTHPEQMLIITYTWPLKLEITMKKTKKYNS